MPVKTSPQLTLRDRLSRLTFTQAGKWLGTDGARLMRKPLRLEIDPGQVLLEDDFLQVTINRPDDVPVVVTLTTADTGKDRVRFTCSEEKGGPEYLAVVLTYVLEEKVTLGLAEPPAEEQPAPLETLGKIALENR